MTDTVPAGSQPTKAVNRTPAKRTAAPKTTSKVKTSKQGLITGWADATIPEDFDHDQAAVHAWTETEPREREKTLIAEMTIADAEELIATCHAVAKSHRERADAANALAAEIAHRLGYEYKSKYETHDPSEPDTEPQESRTILEEKSVRTQTVEKTKAEVLGLPDTVQTPRPIPAFLKQDDVAKAN